MLEQNVVSVATLWEQLRRMEEEGRFDGKPYPAGMVRFPFHLTGQGFFPGGDGLWRDALQIAQRSRGSLAVGGVMFLGNDFGTLRSYTKLRARGFENPPTWRHVRLRIERAKLPSSLAFFTNAVMGLRDGGTALDKKDWEREPQFKSFCREFLAFQIELLKPRLIVVLGPVARATLSALDVGKLSNSGRFHALQFDGLESTVYFCTHPYGDFNFDEERKKEDGRELREAWQWAQAQNN